MDCRGHARREKICASYIIKPVAHLKLLKGQEKKSDAGALVSDQYYVFSAVPRGEEGSAPESILCGIDAAKDLLELSGASPLPLFNPLRAARNAQDAGNDRTQATGTETQDGRLKQPTEARKWDPVAKQLREAILLLIMAWDAVPGSLLFGLLEKTEKYYYLEPYAWKIRTFNSVLKSDAKKRNMDQLTASLRKNNPELKDFDFSLLREKLKEDDLKENRKTVIYI